ncbi:hypothetical protein AgCh_030440 [Apium graveolens]
MRSRERIARLFPSFSSNPADKYIILIDGVLAKVNGSEDCASRNCQSGSLDASKVKGKIVLCFNKDEEAFGKAMNIMNLGRLGVVLVDGDLYLEPNTDYSDLAYPLTANMYDGNAALKGSGALSLAVPRELAGLHKACEQYGRLPWKRLVRPAEHLAHKEFKISIYKHVQVLVGKGNRSQVNGNDIQVPMLKCNSACIKILHGSCSQ